MGKQGPCCHCGVSSTPLWRNGPPEKPVLCNACGSRWRTKGTLANYTPLHARADIIDDIIVVDDHSRLTFKNNLNEIKFPKRKLNVVPGCYNRGGGGGGGARSDDEENVSNRSSSVSAISNPETFGGQMQSVVWEKMVPSKKRTCVGRPKASSVEKLTKDLYTILHEQQSSHLSVSSEEELLIESDTPMVSVEIGHGSMLIRHPNSVKEEESEASSLSESYMPSVVVHRNEKLNKNTANILQLEHTKRDKTQQHEKSYILGNHNSPLLSLDLTDVLNFDVFSQEFSSEEQQQLLKFLPSLDTAGFPHSLQGMFTSCQFKENISSFRKLLAEGVFELQLPGVMPEECRKLKALALTNLSKSNWLERYNLLKNVKCKGRYGDSGVPMGDNFDQPGNSTNGKRTRENQMVNCSGLKISMKSPKRMMMTKTFHDRKEAMNEDGGCFSPRSLFSLPPDNNSLQFDSHHFAEECSDQDLLLNVPSNNSFPEAELLPSSFGAQASTSNSLIY
ncbi:GATA transcription factor 26-like [Impatiens glandulifera]|uniref:GATA transcription factor 26-like n=1 Tax=Impatiens glandulifera TaxID=253017 RepID=UPI001FB11383|nr:GATA transcription factor 26-like [Impatiens glandulifera]